MIAHVTWQRDNVTIRYKPIQKEKKKYTQQKKKVDTFSSLIILYTTSIDGKCHISYERKISPL